MQTIENKILSRIYGRGRGYAFTKIDFVAEFGEANIHQALSSLARAVRCAGSVIDGQGGPASGRGA
jgi:hypothetical protein